MQASKPERTAGARCQGDDDGCYPDQDGLGTVSLCGAHLDDIPHLRDWVPDLQVRRPLSFGLAARELKELRVLVQTLKI